MEGGQAALPSNNGRGGVHTLARGKWRCLKSTPGLHGPEHREVASLATEIGKRPEESRQGLRRKVRSETGRVLEGRDLAQDGGGQEALFPP